MFMFTRALTSTYYITRDLEINLLIGVVLALMQAGAPARQILLGLLLASHIRVCCFVDLLRPNANGNEGDFTH